MPNSIPPAPAWVHAELQRGLAAHQANRPTEAEQHYRRVLAVLPDQPAALQLLGLLAKRRGDHSAALALMRQSVQADPGQPHVWNNLGILLCEMQQPEDALGCFRRALALMPRSADAHLNLASTLHELGRLEEALELLRDPTHADSAASLPGMQLHAVVLSDMRRMSEALALLDRALESYPDVSALHHNRAVALLRCGLREPALQARKRCLALAAPTPHTLHAWAAALQGEGYLDDAVDAYRSALALDPVHLPSLQDLARLRWRRGDDHPFAELDQAIANHPRHAALLCQRAALHLQLGEAAEAASLYSRAVDVEPTGANFNAWGRALTAADSREKAMKALQHAVVLAPQVSDFRAGLAALLLEMEQVVQAEEQIAAALSMTPTHQYALALQHLALRMRGAPRETVSRDLERFVRIVDLPPLQGWTTIEAFGEAVAGALSSMHRDSRAPVDQSLRNGTQTLGDLFERRHPLIEALRSHIATAIDDYVESLPEDATHPFTARRSRRWRFADSWSSLLREGGFHSNHIHPHGWISAVYYVQLPPEIADHRLQAGWLRFGATDLRVRLAEPVLLTVEPRPGRLVLFPSYMWHGTSPNPGQGPRLTIAFDVVPQGAVTSAPAGSPHPAGSPRR
jgi:uncharacterized protein (TIGR02466 family)